MRLFSRAAATLALGMLLAPLPLRAQGAEFFLGGGVGIPLSDFDDFFKMGFQGTAGVSFTPSTVPVGFQVDGNYAQYSDESSLDIKEQLIYGTANAVYKFKSSEETKFRPYIIGGVGLYNAKEKGDDALDGSTTKFGLNAGAGFDFKAGSAGLFIEGRFHNVFTEGSNLKFIPLNVGIRFGGS